MRHDEASGEAKRRHLEDMLAHGRGLVMVHIDPRRDGVQVPPQFRGDPVLRLNIAYGFNLPALDVDDGGVYAMLSFGGQRFGCNLPWTAIFALTMPEEGHRGLVWPEDLPAELKPFFEAAGVSGDAATGAREISLESMSIGQAEPDRPQLAVVRDDTAQHEPEGVAAQSGAATSAGPAEASEDAQERPRPTLRLVK